ncbi:type VII toxin-antitoxin system MntA family adenylyltransferase antitoxin [Nitratifractor salsuginis]|uniref:DNA polymerase beta domain protein region n=1 Tax=Nitratifractor salsuginis (strain DSM 16511 / JCM 12458 / E9I37-1) TaxID=749222 RepID=E6WYT7_NITSE|nr:nucleotidyltransferase domain-containing protein [Nitratifractor salsuginis]ADV46523.1 DNA polymerase beta domain protein region [Nitratifractor salsuginis DSM 16511]
MIDQIKTLLSRDKNVRFAYLFGSYARGDADEKSDVDLAVYLEECSFDIRLELHHRLEKALRRDVDLLCLNELKNIYLLEKILDEGIVVKDHPERDYFEVLKGHEIIDFKNFKRYIDAA